MGDRGNIVVDDGGKRVFLYSHWSGGDLPQVLSKALGRKQRWSDGQYLARIIFCEMLAGSSEGLEGETGFGISAEVGDNEYPYLVVDCGAGKVRIEDADSYKFKGKRREFSFADFVKAGAKGWEGLGGKA